MADPRAQRTLVKSPPELWAELSDPASLTRHLGALGEIRITRLDPETTVAWEGDRVRGTVELEASGWGTRVTLTATSSALGEEEPPPVAAPAPAAAPPPAPTATRRPGLLARFRRRPRATAEQPPPPAPTPLPRPAPAPEHPPLPPAAAALRPSVERVLVEALDELGSASRRPSL